MYLRFGLALHSSTQAWILCCFTLDMRSVPTFSRFHGSHIPEDTERYCLWTYGEQWSGLLFLMFCLEKRYFSLCDIFTSFVFNVHGYKNILYLFYFYSYIQLPNPSSDAHSKLFVFPSLSSSFDRGKESKFLNRCSWQHVIPHRSPTSLDVKGWENTIIWYCIILSLFPFPPMLTFVLMA